MTPPTRPSKILKMPFMAKPSLQYVQHITRRPLPHPKTSVDFDNPQSPIFHELKCRNVFRVGIGLRAGGVGVAADHRFRAGFYGTRLMT